MKETWKLVVGLLAAIGFIFVLLWAMDELAGDVHAATVKGSTSAAGFMYEEVAVSQTDQVCGPTGGAGDFLERVIVKVGTSGANGVVDIQDGTDTAINLVPASTPIGVYSVTIQLPSRVGAWSITTGSAATAICVGKFK